MGILVLFFIAGFMLARVPLLRLLGIALVIGSALYIVAFVCGL